MSKTITPIEARQILASSANKLAGQAAALIRANGDPAELARLFAQGAAGLFVRRDARHPRSRLQQESLLDVCFDDPGKPLVPQVEQKDGYSVHRVTLGDMGKVADVSHVERRVALFRVCLAHGCKPGSNGWRGDLFKHVLNSCFYGESRAAAVLFARVLIETGRVDPVQWARHNYGWHGTLEKLSTLESLGAPRNSPGLLDNCLRYLGCSPNTGETSETRLAVLVAVLDAGGKVSPDGAFKVLFGGDSTVAHARRHLKPGNLQPRILAAVDASLAEAHDDPALSAKLADPEFVSVLTTATCARDSLLALRATPGFPDLYDAIWSFIRPLDIAVRQGDLAAVRLATVEGARFLVASARKGYVAEGHDLPEEMFFAGVTPAPSLVGAVAE